MVPAEKYALEGDWLNFTSESPDEVTIPVLKVRYEDVARIEWIEDWHADQRRAVESEAHRRALGRSDEFDDRFLVSTYAEDEPIRIFIPGGADRWIPERLWRRLVALGQAYELHILPLITGTTEPRFLNAQQVSTLGDEVQFLARIVMDVLVADLVADLRPLLDEAENDTTGDALGIEGG
jgi:hypothetical protein